MTCQAPDVVNLILLPFSVLGGITVFTTGFAAAAAAVNNRGNEEIANAVNRGIAAGFLLSTLPVAVTFLATLQSLG
jgi:hypothetical protein